MFTLGPLVEENNEVSRRIDVPVLPLFGAKDVLNRPETAPRARRHVSGWLTQVVGQCGIRGG